MNQHGCWTLIENSLAASGGEQERQYNELRRRLQDLTAAELISFHQHIWSLMDQAQKNLLWGAAYLVNNGCSDDCFDHFREWLISLGREVFYKVVANPDSLADIVRGKEGYFIFPGLADLARHVYVEMTGQEMPPDPLGSGEPDMGEDWDFEDEEEMRHRLPRLSQLFLTED